MISKMKIMNNSTEKKNSGFSLLELLVVIAILGIMGAIALPVLINPENRSRKAARELMGDMQLARMSAIKTNQDHAIVFVPASDSYSICSDPGADTVWSTIADNTIIKTVTFTGYAAGINYGNGVATTNATGGGGPFPADFVSYTANVLTFNPQGTCSAGYVYLFYGDASYAVGTLTTGIVKIYRWSGGAWR
ncbi:MAG: GspH/FimT family pseudopilin [Desulfobacula sp.]